MNRFIVPLALVLAAASVTTLASPARATVLAELTMDELAARAEIVVFARVRRSGSRTAPLEGRLATVTASVLAVREWLKGRGPADLTVVERGGVRERGRTTVLGVARYVPGESVVAFLARRPEGYVTVGMAQGKFRVLDAEDESRARALRDLRGLSLVPPHGDAAAPREGQLSTAEPLGSFLARVRDAVRRAGGR